MAEKTEISWCDATFNPWIGCSKVHQGCTNCYAERDFDKRRHFAKWGQHGTRVLTSEANWRKPLAWNRDAEAAGRQVRVFCASLADVFEDWEGQLQSHDGSACWVNAHDEVTWQAMPGRTDWILFEEGYKPLRLDDVRRRLFRLIDKTPWLDWILVTKRPENVRRMWQAYFPGGYIAEAGAMNQEGPRPNVWLLTSVSDQATADTMVPELLTLRDLVPVLGLSIEPLLGPIELDYALSTGDSFVDKHLGWLDVLDWIIVGGESGPNARPMHPNWVRSLRDQATSAGVAFHFKQHGEWCAFQDIPDEWLRSHEVESVPSVLIGERSVHRIGKAAAGSLLDGRTWGEFPMVARA